MFSKSKTTSTDLHAGCEGSVDLCYDVDYLSNPGAHTQTQDISLYYQHKAMIIV